MPDIPLDASELETWLTGREAVPLAQFRHQAQGCAAVDRPFSRLLVRLIIGKERAFEPRKASVPALFIARRAKSAISISTFRPAMRFHPAARKNLLQG